MKKLTKYFLLLLFAFTLFGCTAERTTSETKTASAIQTDENQWNNKEKDIASIHSSTDNIKNSSILNIYYIDVGQGDACLLESNNCFMLIDARDNNTEQLVVDFLTDKGVDKLDYVFATHPHADHIGGLDAVIDNFLINKIYMPKISANTKTFEDVLDALEEKGLQVNSPAAGTDFIFGDTTIEILAPINSYENLNNHFIVLRLTFQENSYGHPNETVMKRIIDKNISLYRTDQNSTIQAISNGNEISFAFTKENVSDAKIQQEPVSGIQTQTKEPDYIGNKNSKKFHLPSCHTLPAEKNSVSFDTREDAVNAGFAACKNCNP